MKHSGLLFGVLLLCVGLLAACSDDGGNDLLDGDTDGTDDEISDGDQPDGDTPIIVPDGDKTDGDEPDGDAPDGDDPDGDGTDGDDPDGDGTDGDDPDGDVDGDATDGDADEPIVDNLLPPPAMPDTLGYDLPAREAAGEAPTQAEITAFTKKVTGFFKDTDYWNWVWRTSHGLEPGYDDDMMDYKLWWQDVGMRKEGDTIVFFHSSRAENILKRTIKVMDNAIAGYLLTGDERMGEVARQLMKGIVALSLGLERDVEDPLVKYLQARAVFNHNHSYEVDGRQVAIDYEPMYTPSFKWNVHVFEIPDNPTYGKIWVSNMRSKDDVPYVQVSLAFASWAYHQATDQSVRDAAELYIEYMRGFSQSIVDNGWYILTKYEDGEAVIAYDATKEGNPPADLGSYVHWLEFLGPDAECNAQLGAALVGYGATMGKGHCDHGKVGWTMEKMAGGTNWFNYNIYNYFHIGAVFAANAWSRWDIAGPLMEGLTWRFDQMMHNEELGNRDHVEFQSDMAGWLLTAATSGYPLNAEEARHIMDWYGKASDWYRLWPHWDPWTSMTDGQEFSDYKAPRVENVDDGQGGTVPMSHIRLVEMPYIFGYCFSPHRSGVEFIDCDIVADPSQWGEDD